MTTTRRIKLSRGQALTEYIVVAGAVSVVTFLALVGDPSRFGGDVTKDAAGTVINTAEGQTSIKGLECDPVIDVSEGAASLAAQRQSCVKKKIFAL